VDGEHVAFRTTLHAAVLVFPMIALATIGLVFGFAGVGVLLSLVVACWLAVELANHRVSEFAVTNRRVLMKRGYIPRRVLETPLETVEGIEVAQSALGRTLGYGTLIVRGVDGHRHAFPSLHHPMDFRERVPDQLGGA